MWMYDFRKVESYGRLAVSVLSYFGSYWINNVNDPRRNVTEMVHKARYSLERLTRITFYTAQSCSIESHISERSLFSVG